MKKSNPLRLHFILFLILSIVAIAQLSWWVIFQVQEGARINSLQKSIWNQQRKVASAYFENTELSDTEKSSWLTFNFPDLELDDDGNLKITSEAARSLDELAQKRVRMFVSEGAFFSLLILTGIWFFYWALRKRIDVEDKIESVLSSATTSLIKPITSINEDLRAISATSGSGPIDVGLLTRISSNIQKITDTCESVSLIRLLATSKRKIELELTDISKILESVINDYKKTHARQDFQINSDIHINLVAVTNPHQLARIFQDMMRISDNYIGEKGIVDVQLSKELKRGILSLKWDPATEKEDPKAIFEKTESELVILRGLSETIGVKIEVLTGDDDSICLSAELPLLEDG
jgi:hypothetical protein